MKPGRPWRPILTRVAQKRSPSWIFEPMIAVSTASGGRYPSERGSRALAGGGDASVSRRGGGEAGGLMLGAETECACRGLPANARGAGFVSVAVYPARHCGPQTGHRPACQGPGAERGPTPGSGSGRGRRWVPQGGEIAVRHQWTPRPARHRVPASRHALARRSPLVFTAGTGVSCLTRSPQPLGALPAPALLFSAPATPPSTFPLTSPSLALLA